MLFVMLLFGKFVKKYMKFLLGIINVFKEGYYVMFFFCIILLMWVLLYIYWIINIIKNLYNFVCGFELYNIVLERYLYYKRDFFIFIIIKSFGSF